MIFRRMLSIEADDPRAVALVSAIHAGDVEALQLRLHSDPDLATARIVDRRGVARTLLHIVADWPGHFPHGAQTVAALIAAGAAVNAPVIHPRPDGAPEAPLHWAASSDDVGVLDALLDGGADLEAPGAVLTGGAPISDAVVFGQWRAARRLVERGAKTTIWQAAALGLLDRVRALSSVVPPPARDQITNACWHACHGGQQPTVEYLLDRGADLNWVGHDGRTPCDMAEESGNAPLMQWLRAHGAKRAAELK
jgi:ankyrin repeat protein